MTTSKTKVWSAAVAVSLSYTGAAFADGHTADVYAPYAGTTLGVNFPAHPHYNAVLDVLPEFTEQTGIEVEVDQLQYLKMQLQAGAFARVHTVICICRY